MKYKQFDHNRPDTIKSRSYQNEKPRPFSEMVTDYLSRKEGIINVNSNDLFYRFKRYSSIDPYNHMGLTREFVFITKPNLQIFYPNTWNLREYLSNIPLFIKARQRYLNVLIALSFDSYKSMPFNVLLSNSISANIDLPDISTSNDYETGKTIMGSSIFYRGHSWESDENFEFSIEFTDSRNLDVYMWFKLFDEYERLKHLGRIPANTTANDKTYIYNKRIHDQFSLYKFIVSEDGESVIHFSKFTGVYPKSVPRSTFGDMPADGILKFTVNFKASFVEDLNPFILTEFNNVASFIKVQGLENDGYTSEYGGWSGAWCVKPYLTIEDPKSLINNGPLGRFEQLPGRVKLKWQSFKDTDDFLYYSRTNESNELNRRY